MRSVHIMLVAFFTLLLSMAAVANDQNAIDIQYDRATDTFTLEEISAPLSVILRKMSVLSGVEVKLAPEEDRDITVSFEKRPTEKAFQDLSRPYGLNVITGYQRDSEGKNMLTAFYVLKEGEMSAAGLPPLVDLQFEVLNQTRRANEYGATHTAKRVYQRWEKRFSQLPPVVRSRLQEKAQKNIERAQAREARKKEKMEQREARLEEKRQRRQKRLEEMKKADPARYELKMQRRAELKARALKEAERRREANSKKGKTPDDDLSGS